MKKTVLSLTLLLAFTVNLMAQTPRQVLDKAAKIVTSDSGVKADFKLTNSVGSTSGTIAIKGAKFHATTPQAIVWYDGKTQWTYVKNNDEVNVTTPTAAQQQAINPYTFIHLYRQGYKMTMNKTASAFTVHLTAQEASRKIQELFITVDKKSYHPTQVKMLQGKKWTTFDISGIKKQQIADATFRFNQKDFPSAEVIDLR